MCNVTLFVGRNMSKVRLRSEEMKGSLLLQYLLEANFFSPIKCHFLQLNKVSIFTCTTN